MWTDVKAAAGKSIWDGIAIGRLRWFQKREVQAQSISGLAPEEELERFEQARARAQAQLPKLRGCDAHFTVVLSDVDEKLYRRLGIHVSCEPKYERQRLYFK